MKDREPESAENAKPLLKVPKPRIHARKGSTREEEGEGKAWGRSGVGRKGFRRRNLEIGGGEGFTATRARARSRGRKRKLPIQTPGRGLYGLAVGSPDAIYVAPDACGDHRTKTQRVF